MKQTKKYVIGIVCLCFAVGMFWVGSASASNFWDSVADFGSWLIEDSGWSQSRMDSPFEMGKSIVEPQGLTPVPIPGTAVLLGSGLASLLGLRSRKGKELVEKITRKNLL